MGMNEKPETDEGVVTPCGIMTPEMWQGIRDHYQHAVAKHPYFADAVARFLDNPTCKAGLEINRNRLKELIRDRRVDVETVFNCEWAEIMEAYTRGDKAAAIEECYDAIAVLLRMVDVIEGRQPLGRPVVSEMETTGTEGGAE